jgi:hypothetical protein
MAMAIEWRTVGPLPMDKRRFSEVIAEAVQHLGAEEAASCMARSLLYLAHASGDDMVFTCDLGTVDVDRTTIPAAAKH